jgi:hypothetical protein
VQAKHVTVLNTPQWVQRVMDTKGALTGLLLYIPAKALSDRGGHSLGRTLIGGGALAGAAIMAAGAALHIDDRNIEPVRRDPVLAAATTSSTGLEACHLCASAFAQTGRIVTR